MDMGGGGGCGGVFREAYFKMYQVDVDLCVYLKQVFVGKLLDLYIRELSII